MTDGPTNPMAPGGSTSLINRVKNILFSPKTEWAVIDAEQSTVGSILTGYVLIIAAIGPIAGLIGGQLIGVSMFGVTYHPPIAMGIVSAVIAYILAILGVYVAAFVIDALASSFGAVKSSVGSFKVAAYAATAGMVAQIVQIVPMLGMLALLGSIYGWYLLYLGLGTVMKSPADKSIVYTIVVVVVQIVLYFVFAMILAALIASFFGAAMMASGAAMR